MEKNVVFCLRRMEQVDLKGCQTCFQDHEQLQKGYGTWKNCTEQNWVEIKGDDIVFQKLETPAKNYKKAMQKFWIDAFGELDVYLKKGPGRHGDLLPGIPLKEYCRKYGFSYQIIWETITGRNIATSKAVLKSFCPAAQFHSLPEKRLSLIVTLQAKFPQEHADMFEEIKKHYEKEARLFRKQFLQTWKGI